MPDTVTKDSKALKCYLLEMCQIARGILLQGVHIENISLPFFGGGGDCIQNFTTWLLLYHSTVSILLRLRERLLAVLRIFLPIYIAVVINKFLIQQGCEGKLI